MRSWGVDDFLLFINQSMQKSSILRVAYSGSTGDVVAVVLDGRATGAGPDRLTIKGKDCEVTLDLAAAEFESSRGKDFSSRETWMVTLPSGGVFTVTELVGGDPV